MSAEEADMMDDDMMASDSAALFWSMKLEQNQPQEIDQPAIEGYIVHVTNACFGANVIKGSRTVVMVNPGDSADTSAEAPVCVLRQGQHENQSLDLLFNESATISIKGQKPSPVYLTGYIQPPVDDKDDMNPMMEDMDEEALEQMLRQQRSSQRDLDGEDEEEEEEPTLVDEEDEEEEAPVEPPSKKQKTGKGEAKSTKNGAESPKKRKLTKKDDEEDTKQEETAAAGKKKKSSKKMQNMKGGIKYRDMKVGSGKQLAAGDSVSVFYVGQLDDKKVFDKAITGNGFEFNFGKGDVIKGWDLGLKGMKVGGKRKLIIPAKLAYGANGSPPAVPPNAQLTFTIEVKSAK